MITDNVNWFNQLHKITRPDRYIADDYIEKVYNLYGCIIYATQTAGAMIRIDGNTAYYLFGARDKGVPNDNNPSLVLWEAIKNLHDMGIEFVDLCGANKPNIAFFKRGFGGELIKTNKKYLP